MFTLPSLPYAYDALEPYFDAETMRLHHDKHHAAYVDKLNTTLKDNPDLQTKPIDELLIHIDTIPGNIRDQVINFGGGHANHSLFWETLAPADPNHPSVPSGSLAQALTTAFGSFEAFQSSFTTMAANLFGSGWVWLVKTPDNQLKLCPLPNQNSPLSLGDTPLLGLDVWEHAYYLKYQNRRAEYIETWWNLVNWPQVDTNFTS